MGDVCASENITFPQLLLRTVKNKLTKQSLVIYNGYDLGIEIKILTRYCWEYYKMIC